MQPASGMPLHHKDRLVGFFAAAFRLRSHAEIAFVPVFAQRRHIAKVYV
jgi:hypothetical protein